MLNNNSFCIISCDILQSGNVVNAYIMYYAKLVS